MVLASNEHFYKQAIGFYECNISYPKSRIKKQLSKRTAVHIPLIIPFKDARVHNLSYHGYFLAWLCLENLRHFSLGQLSQPGAVHILLVLGDTKTICHKIAAAIGSMIHGTIYSPRENKNEGCRELRATACNTTIQREDKRKIFIKY